MLTDWDAKTIFGGRYQNRVEKETWHRELSLTFNFRFHPPPLATMPGILDLPTELREMIFLYVVRSQRDPPDVNALRNGRRRVSRKDPRVLFRPVYWEDPLPAPGFVALQSVSRLFYHEMEYILRREARIQSESHLDVALMLDGDARPTWTRLPVPLKEMRTIRVTLREVKDPQCPREYGFSRSLGIATGPLFPLFETLLTMRHIPQFSTLHTIFLAWNKTRPNFNLDGESIQCQDLPTSIPMQEARLTTTIPSLLSGRIC